MPSKIDGAISCAEDASACFACGRERASSPGLGSFACGASAVSPAPLESLERGGFADSLRDALEAGCVSRREGALLKGTRLAATRQNPPSIIEIGPLHMQSP